MSVRLPPTRSTGSSTNLPTGSSAQKVDSFTPPRSSSTVTRKEEVKTETPAQPALAQDLFTPPDSPGQKTTYQPPVPGEYPDGPVECTDRAPWQITTFDPGKTGFDPETAVAMTRAASLAYFEAADIKLKLKESGYDSFKFYDTDEAQAFTAADKDRIIISFRGTQAKRREDLLTDANVLRRGDYCLPGRVHLGFISYLDWVWPNVLAEVKRLVDENPNRKVFVTGHSLGGAAATLCAARLHKEGVPIQAVYPVASPRVGNWRFANEYNHVLGDRTFRLVNHRDIVTRIPFGFGYRHVGGKNVRYFHHDGKVSAGLGFWEMAKDRFHDLVFRTSLGDLKLDAVQDHNAAGYILLAEQMAREARDPKPGFHFSWSLPGQKRAPKNA